VAVAWPKHQAMIAEPDRAAVAVGGRVPHMEYGHRRAVLETSASLNTTASVAIQKSASFESEMRPSE
jgi:hypothetical protein